MFPSNFYTVTLYKMQSDLVLHSPRNFTWVMRGTRSRKVKLRKVKQKTH